MAKYQVIQTFQLPNVRKHTQMFVQLLPYLWPKGWDLRIRVILSAICLILARVTSVLIPFAYKYSIDSLATLEFPWQMILLYGSGSLFKEYYSISKLTNLDF
jgi:ABC-type multidrug transport system fused ATPase/permease subunit